MLEIKINFVNVPNHILNDQLLKPYSVYWSYSKNDLRKIFNLVSDFTNQVRNHFNGAIKSIHAKDGIVTLELASSAIIDSLKDFLSNFNSENYLFGFFQERI